MIEEDRVRELYDLGLCAWPELGIGFGPFAAHCQRVLEAPLGDAPRAHAADLLLACASALGHPVALRLLEREAYAVMRAAIARVHRDPEFVQETIQEVWDKLLGGTRGRISDYAARGPLKAWLRISAVRTALDSRRKVRVQNRRSVELDDALAAERPLSAESLLIRERYAASTQLALRRAIASLAARDRNLLRMQVVGRCSIDQIALAYGCHRATAARWLDATRRRVFDGVLSDLAHDHPALSASELRAIVETLGSFLALTLSATAGATEPPNTRER